MPLIHFRPNPIMPSKLSFARTGILCTLTSVAAVTLPLRDFENAFDPFTTHLFIRTLTE